MAELLDVDGLSIRLPPGADRPLAVEDLRFTLARGEILCVVGESGSGKSMTANAIMGLLPKPHVAPVAGSVRFDGVDLLTRSEAELRALRGKRVAMIFQEPMTALNPVMRIGDQIAEVFRFHGEKDRGLIQRRVVELLGSVGLPDPEGLRHAYPFRLSGGQRQRVMIAMALALEPAMLIADEPTTALDVTTQAQILALIRDIQRRRGMGVMFITHDFGVVAEIADRVAVMRQGQLVEIGTADQVLNQPQHAYTRRLIRAVPHATSAPVEAAPPPTEKPDIVLSVQGLRKTYHSRGGFLRPARTVEAVKGVSFTIRRGETLGLVGESGSGKSTVGRCIVRLEQAAGGHIRFRDLDFAELSGEHLRRHRRHIQMVFQDPYASLNPRRKIGRIIAEGPEAHGVSRQEAMDRARDLLRLVGLDASAADRYPHEFSGGQRQRIGIARALALEPELIVADEPVSALDVSVQAQVLALLDDIKRRLGLSLLFITHDLRVAAQICDHIAVMRRGELVEYGEADKVFADPQHAYTRELLAAVPGKHWTIPDLPAEESDV